MTFSPEDHAFFELAYKQAELAYSAGEVPVGAVVVHDGQVIAKARNQIEELGDACAHAEILAIKEASKSINNWRLTGCELYVTLEPCPMCMGAIRLARLKRVVFGAFDQRMGGAGSKYDLTGDQSWGPLAEVAGGLEEERCRTLIRQFFQERRTK